MRVASRGHSADRMTHSFGRSRGPCRHAGWSSRGRLEIRTSRLGDQGDSRWPRSRGLYHMSPTVRLMPQGASRGWLRPGVVPRDARPCELRKVEIMNPAAHDRIFVLGLALGEGLRVREMPFDETWRVASGGLTRAADHEGQLNYAGAACGRSSTRRVVNAETGCSCQSRQCGPPDLGERSATSPPVGEHPSSARESRRGDAYAQISGAGSTPKRPTFRDVRDS